MRGKICSINQTRCSQVRFSFSSYSSLKIFKMLYHVRTCYRRKWNDVGQWKYRLQIGMRIGKIGLERNIVLNHNLAYYVQTNFAEYYENTSVFQHTAFYCSWFSTQICLTEINRVNSLNYFFL